MRFIITVIALGFLFGQNSSNPDFSAIGQLHIENNESGTHLNGSDLELAVTGYVNPYAKAGVYLHLHDAESGFELEEAHINIERGLPLELGLLAGRIKPSFGRINTEHSHTWPFINAPESFSAWAGPESWSSDGFELSSILPLPFFVELSGGLINKGFNSEGHGHEEENHADEEPQSSYTAIGHSAFFIELSSTHYMELGASIISGVDSSFSMAGLDLKYRWKPDSYRGLTIQSEYFLPGGTLKENFEQSFYGMVNFQFNKYWNTGFMLDGIKHPDEELEVTPSIFFGFSPVEESTVTRLLYRHSEETGNEISLQLIWSLGPHKPHVF